MSLVLALTTALADVAPPDRVFSESSRNYSKLGVIVASLAVGAAVVSAATLFVWRRSGRGAGTESVEASAVRQAALGSVSLKLCLAWVMLAALPFACLFLLGTPRWLELFAFITLLILCPLLGATGTALGGIALTLTSPTPRLRRWRALVGVVLNIVPVLFLLLALLDEYRRATCRDC